MATRDLAVNLIAHTGRFQADMRKASGVVTGFASRVKGTFARMGRSLGGAATNPVVSLLTGAAVIRSIQNSVRWGDEVAKTSRRLGIQAERLQELQFAAEQSGVGIRTMNMALQRMTRRMAEAAKETGEARAAIAELELDPVALAKAGPHAALLAIADALKNVENQSDRVRLMFKLFDSEGVPMLQMLDQGSAGLRNMADQLQSLGGPVSGEALQKIEQMKDAFNRLAWSIKIAGAELTAFSLDMVEWLQKQARYAVGGVMVAGHGLELVDERTIKEYARMTSKWQMEMNAARRRLGQGLPAMPEMPALGAAGRPTPAPYERVGSAAAQRTIAESMMGGGNPVVAEVRQVKQQLQKMEIINRRIMDTVIDVGGDWRILGIDDASGGVGFAFK